MLWDSGGHVTKSDMIAKAWKTITRTNLLISIFASLIGIIIGTHTIYTIFLERSVQQVSKRVSWQIVSTASHSTITGAPLIAALEDLVNAEESLQGQKLVNKTLIRAQLVGGDFEGAIFDGSNLNESNLSGSNLQEASFRGTTFQGAQLEGAKMDGRTLFESDFSDEQLKTACYDSSYADDPKKNFPALLESDPDLERKINVTPKCAHE